MARRLTVLPAALLAAPALAAPGSAAALFDDRSTRKGKRGDCRDELYQDIRSKQDEEALRQRDRARSHSESTEVDFVPWLPWSQPPGGPDD